MRFAHRSAQASFSGCTTDCPYHALDSFDMVASPGYQRLMGYTGYPAVRDWAYRTSSILNSVL
jgi:hypothetical protein